VFALELGVVPGADPSGSATFCYEIPDATKCYTVTDDTEEPLNVEFILPADSCAAYQFVEDGDGFYYVLSHGGVDMYGVETESGDTCLL
jgi:hypothetical protein